MLKRTSRKLTIAVATSALSLFGAGAALAEDGGGDRGNNPACTVIATVSGVNQTFPIPGLSSIPAPGCDGGGENGGGESGGGGASAAR